MNTKISIEKFITEAENTALPILDYIKKIPNNKLLYSTEIISFIDKVRVNKNEHLLESVLLIARHDGLSYAYTPILCTLLQEDWHYSQEDVVMMLEEIKDPSSIEPLYKTAIAIPDFDDGRSLAKKCIWALGTIATTESIRRLTQLSHSEDEIIREIAFLELKSNSQN